MSNPWSQWTGNGLRPDSSAWDFVANPPRARLSKSGAQNCLNDTFVPLTWDVEDYDDFGFHSGSATTIVVPSAAGAGIYDIKVSGGFALNSTGARMLSINKNGFQIAGDSKQTVSGAFLPPYLTAVWEGPLAVADSLEVLAYQNSGVASPGLSFSAFGFSIRKVAPS